MPDLVVVVPSRGRPSAAVELADAFLGTCTADTLLNVVVDTDDPTLERYPVQGLTIGVHHSMTDALNKAAQGFANLGQGLRPFAIGFMGDDHRPRTVGWDQAYLDALRDEGTGIVYGNDLLQGANLPTQVAMTSDIIRALGFMAPPNLGHMYVDNFWRDLGRAAGCLRYLPDVVVEHMHPIAGKAEWDEGHTRVNDSAVYQRDQRAYGDFWTSGQMTTAIEKVMALRSVRA